jgi:hypothetical protein
MRPSADNIGRRPTGVSLQDVDRCLPLPEAGRLMH